MKKILFAALIALCTIANAQNTSKDVQTILTSAEEIEFAWQGGSALVPVMANNDYTISGIENTWVSAKKTQNGLILTAKSTSEDEERQLTVTLVTADGSYKRSIVVSQEADGSASTITDTAIMPLTKTASSAQTGEGVERLFDGDLSTLWHSTYSVAVNSSNPVTLTMTFSGKDVINYMLYTPRSSGSNGIWTAFKVAITTAEGTTTKEYSGGGSTSPLTINFPDNCKPTKVVVTITGGVAGYASGAELGFYQSIALTDDTKIFADDMLSTLVEGTTQADVNKLENPFFKNLAQRILDNDYETNYRVSEYPCRLSYSVLSDEWNAPGKYYSQLDNPTGINFKPNQKRAVVVSGIPEDMTVSLAIVAWYVGKDGSNFDGGNPYSTYFALHNGINIINYTYDYAGLGYIQYYASTRERYEQGVPNIKVHVINGHINGILTPDKTNAEMQQLCKNAAASGNPCIDVYGKKVQSVWTSAGLRDYCKASDGKSLGYRQYMNVLDSLIAWEHRELGLEKYNRIPDNHTFAYTNYTYYMFQGGLGVSFHHDQESRVLNCKTLMLNDNDAIWGLSHEWGHQHQMTPYMCWSGMSEVSNNIFSYYNVMHMGYTYERSGWSTCAKYFLNNEYPTTAGQDGLEITISNKRAVSARRKEMYDAVSSSSSMYSYSKDMRDLCLAEVDSFIYRYQAKPSRALSLYDTGVGTMLGALIMPGNYAKLYVNRNTKEISTDVLLNDGYLDFYPDLFEAMRQSDNIGTGSTVEKQSGIDKYELINAAQNGNKNNLYSTLANRYPTSCWVTENYLNSGGVSYTDNSVPAAMNFVRKASRLMGYNLFPFFDDFGMFRIGAYQIGDYGKKRYVCTQKMYDEFKADMEALVTSGEIKAMPEGMKEAMFNCRHLNASKTDKIYSTPNIAN